MTSKRHQTWSIETITPTKATRYLKMSTVNRHLYQAHIDKFAGAMKRGEWKLNGDSIKFNRNGVFWDGHHRLTAVIKSGVPVKMEVRRGLDPDKNTYRTIDTDARPRTPADYLSIAGVLYAKDIQSGINLLHHIKTRTVQMKAPGLTTRQVLDFVQKNPEVCRYTEDIHATKGVRVAPASIVIALRHLFSQKDDSLAAVFFSSLLTGENITAKNPVYLLRDRLLRDRASRLKMTRLDKVRLVITAWNAVRGGKMVKSLQPFTRAGLPKIR